MANDDYEAAAKKLAEAGYAMSHLDDGQILALGHEAMGLIIARTRTGLDADGSPFVPYSAAYTEIRRIKGLSASTVDLAVTGHMLGAMTVTGRSGEAEIAFQSTQEAKKAAAHNFGALAKPTKAARKAASAARKKQKAWYRKLYRTVTGKRAKKISAARNQKLPERNFFDVRLDAEWQALSELAGVQLQGNVQKVFSK